MACAACCHTLTFCCLGAGTGASSEPLGSHSIAGSRYDKFRHSGPAKQYKVRHSILSWPHVGGGIEEQKGTAALCYL